MITQIDKGVVAPVRARAESKQTSKSKLSKFSAKATRETKPHPTLAERFWSRVDKSAGPFECWLWTGSVRTDGYGKLHINRKAIRGAHVFALLGTQPLPRGAVVMHSCNCPTCCNPLHLSVGTQRQNLQDAGAQGRLGRRMTREDIRQALTFATEGFSANEIASKLGVNPTAIRHMFRGKTNRNVTGIPRNVAVGGRGKGRDPQIYRDALAFMGAKGTASNVSSLTAHPKFRRNNQPGVSTSAASI